MKFRFALINMFLCLAVLFTASCKTTDDKKKSKEASVIRLFLESSPTDSLHTTTASVYREQPVLIHIDIEPILTEGDLDEANLTPALGSHAIRLQFNRHGTWILESYTTRYNGRRLAIFANFGQSRWLAAPTINRPIKNGEFIFTPDATFEESERIVHGLNNMIAEIKKKEG